jgi:hypothetical protein
MTNLLFCLVQDNPRSTAIKAVAKANNLELNIVETEAGKPSIEHLKASGLGKIPAFLGEDGFALSESIAIAIYGKFDRFASTSSNAPRIRVMQLRDDLAFQFYSYPCLKLFSYHCVDIV